MAEVAHAGEDHGDAGVVRGGDHFLISHRAARLNHNFDPVFLRDIDAVAQRAMAEWNVPGMAIGVVYRGETLYAKGLGIRELGQAEPVDTDKPVNRIIKSCPSISGKETLRLPPIRCSRPGVPGSAHGRASVSGLRE